MNKKKIFFGIAGLAMAFLVSAWGINNASPGLSQQSAEELYQAALLKIEAEGDLSGAIKLLQGIIVKFPDRREVAAKAQLQIGICHQKLGTKEAEKAFQKVIDNYPDQSEAVRQAKEKLSLLLRAQALFKTGVSEFNLRQVWAGPLVDILGAVSPDGRYLSFVDWMTGDLAVRDLASGKNRRLTNKGSWQQSREFAMFSEWAPDSQRIVYQWYNKDETFELRIIDIQGLTPHILYQSPKKDEYVHPFACSPDGKFILAGFYVLGDRSVEEFVYLGLVPLDEGSPKVLKTQPEVHPSARLIFGSVFSPDGKYIACNISQEGTAHQKGDIVLLSADGSTETPLIEHPANDTVLDWAPGGEGLLFQSDRTGTLDIWFVRVADGKAQGSPLLIKPGVGLIIPMGITSQGTFYYGLQGGATDVYEVEIDPETGKILSQAKKAVLYYERHNAYPDYSPDGKQLAYISSRGPLPQQRQFLCILTLGTDKIRELHPDLDTLGYPQWAPDGRSISVEGTDKNDRRGIYRVDSQTGDVVPIVTIEKGTEIYSNRWSKDGKLLYYSTGNRGGGTGSIFIHNFETGRDEPLSGSPSGAHWIDISPDGKWLALMNRHTKRIVGVMSTSGGGYRELCSFEEPGGDGIITPAWSADGRYIYFYSVGPLDNSLDNLHRVSVDGGEPQKIDLTMARFRHLSAHPDGQRIAFSSQGTNPAESQVWVMENFLPKTKEAQAGNK